MNTTLEHLTLLAASLAIGLLIGIERGWKRREAKEGERIAGIRTFGLIALLGGCTGLLSTQFTDLVFGLTFIGLAFILSVAYALNLKQNPDVSITGLVAALLTFILGTLTTLGYVGLAGSVAVVATILLGMKPILHRWLENLQQDELYAGLKLLLISVVLLSILPNEWIGPMAAFNPFEIWWMVVLVASISFLGYFAMKFGGPKKGVFITALISGMISSTALTYHFSILAKQRKSLQKNLSLGVLLACGMMFPRLLLWVVLLKVSLLEQLLLPIFVMMALLCFPVVLFVLKKPKILPTEEQPPLQNPLELSSAIIFGIILTIIIFSSKTLENYFGELGLYLLALISGLVDIDAITLTMTRMHPISQEIAAFSILLAAVSNTLLKGVLAFGIAGKPMLLRVTLPLLSVGFIGLLMGWWLIVL